MIDVGVSHILPRMSPVQFGWGFLLTLFSFRLKQLLIMKNLYSVIFLVASCLVCYSQEEVPHSPHAENQLLQGPCYIFAAVAALESKAMLAGSIAPNFNEWKYWSTCVLGNDININSTVLSPKVIIENTVNHMKANGAIQKTNAHDYLQKSQLPNHSLCSAYAGIADFDCSSSLNGGNNGTWCDNYGGYSKNSTSLGPVCKDHSVGNDVFTFTPNLILGHKDVSFNNLTFKYSSSNTGSTEVINQLQAGNGVIAVINNYRTASCGGTTYAAQHAIFIYKHSGGKFFFKDSWPGDGNSAGEMNVSTYNNSDIQSISYLEGNAVCHNGCEPDDVEEEEENLPCDYNISGPSLIGCSTVSYRLTGGTGTASNISWQVPTGVTIVSGANNSRLRVKASNCGATISGVIQITYTDINSCNDTPPKAVSVAGGNVSKPSGIQFNGPISISEYCPGSAAQLVAIDNNSSHCPIYDWSISGATILNGHGTNTINILSNSTAGAHQSYSVRVKKECGSYTSWTRITGYLGDYCEDDIYDGDGGVGIFPAAQIQDDFGGDYLFQEDTNLKLLNLEIIDLFGRTLEKVKVARGESGKKINMNSFPSGILIVRYYDESMKFLTTRKIMVKHKN